MEMINVTELSEIDILQLQFTILEELKHKKTNGKSDSNQDAINFVSKRFKDKNGIYESDKCYSYRQIWFENGCCSYRRLAKIIGKTHANLQQIAKRYDWHKIKEKAFDLGYTPNSNILKSHDDSKLVKRNSPEYQKYHDKILNRDKFCQCCGSSENLEVHHPMPFNKYNSIGADINNGIVLCKECHTEYHSQNGYKKNCNPTTLAQFLRDYAKPFPSELNSSVGDTLIDPLLDPFSNKYNFIPSRVYRVIRSHAKEHGGCTKDVVESELDKKYNISKQEVESGIKTLIQQGRIYNPEPGYYKIV